MINHHQRFHQLENFGSSHLKKIDQASSNAHSAISFCEHYGVQLIFQNPCSIGKCSIESGRTFLIEIISPKSVVSRNTTHILKFMSFSLIPFLFRQESLVFYQFQVDFVILEADIDLVTVHDNFHLVCIGWMFTHFFLQHFLFPFLRKKFHRRDQSSRWLTNNQFRQNVKESLLVCQRKLLEKPNQHDKVPISISAWFN